MSGGYLQERFTNVQNMLDWIDEIESDPEIGVDKWRYLTVEVRLDDSARRGATMNHLEKVIKILSQALELTKSDIDEFEFDFEQLEEPKLSQKMTEEEWEKFRRYQENPPQTDEEKKEYQALQEKAQQAVAASKGKKMVDYLKDVIAQMEEYKSPVVTSIPEKAYEIFDVDGLLEFGHTEEEVNDLFKAWEMTKEGEIRSMDDLQDFLGYGRFMEEMLESTFEKYFRR
jgi:hypothetical protein